MSEPELDRLTPDLVQRLEGAGYALREPVTRARWDELVHATGGLPDGVGRYLATTDGLDHAKRGAICGSEQMLKPYPSNSLLPLQDDGSGNCDAVLIEPGAGFGAVVFWDHETMSAEYLVASSVPMYLAQLTSSPPSDARSRDEFLRAHDPAAIRLREDTQFATLIGESGPRYTPGFEPAPPPGSPLPKGAREGINPFTKERIIIMPRATYRTPPNRR